MFWNRVLLSWMTLLAVVFASATATAAADVSPKTHIGVIDLAASTCIEGQTHASAEEHLGNPRLSTAATSDVPHAAREAATAIKGIVAANGTKITGFTRHGLNRAIGDGAKRAGTKASSILDALKNPKSIKSGVDELGRPFQTFKGSSARVVVNPETGQIISVNPIGRAGVR